MLGPTSFARDMISMNGMRGDVRGGGGGGGGGGEEGGGGQLSSTEASVQDSPPHSKA